MEVNNVTISDDISQQIKPINVDTVHKICSGQVVLSLAVAVKELVENSLDAGATNIDIRFKNYGVDLIEVSDNGCGVTEDNYAALTLKYHTSKLNEYSDLLGVASFGFRGEALSSLCALADLTVTTRHKNAEYATKIEYDHKGNVVKKTPCSRQIGTTVTLSNLFASLPVRQKEFHKNVKREFNKMTQLLYAYCLISLGVKITCHNQTSTNPKSVVVATQGSTFYKDNIACIFGLKQLQSLLEIKPEYVTNIKDNIFRGLSGEHVDIKENEIVEDIEIDLSEDSNDAENSDKSNISSSQKSQGHKNMPQPVQFTGFISSCEHGSGRSSTDRQFYFVNSRPCEPVKIIKLINEIYRQYNGNQYPFVFLNVDIDRTSVDVNVTPDKRKVFLTKEKLILDTLKYSLVKLYESIPRTLKVEPLINNKVTNGVIKPEINQPKVFNAFIQTFANKTNASSTIQENKTKLPNTDLKRKSTTMLDFIASKKAQKLTYSDEFADSICNTKVKQEVLDSNCVSNNCDEAKTSNITVGNNHTDYEDTFCETKYYTNERVNDGNEKTDTIYLEFTDNLPNTQIRTVSEVLEEKSSTIYCKTKNTNSKLSNNISDKPAKKPKLIVTDKEDLGKQNRRSVVLKTSLEHVKSLLNIYNQKKGKEAPKRVKFRSTIDPVFNKKCEEELSKEISKSNFNEMNVVGQFNLGFIIARLNDDLFIIDQHATDEIYNFEMLQKTTELTNQKLVIPQQLELTGVNEQILMDHLDTFRKNGFTFEINENELPTKRVKLLTIPMSKNWIFGKEDIEELLFMLRESTSEYCRPSRVRAMFASRACRKSVMIGTALSNADMKKLVNHMAEIDKPWNCPHGRPTIRHLVNLAMVHTKEG